LQLLVQCCLLFKVILKNGHGFFLDYHIREKLLEYGLDEHFMRRWALSDTNQKGQQDIFRVVKETIWKKSIDYHFPLCECDSILFALPQNYNVAEKVIEYFKKVLSPLQPKIEIYEKESWEPLHESNGSLWFRRGAQNVSSRLAFLLVTSEFCADPEGWAYLAGESFFQKAMYNKEITTVPILVNNPRKSKFRIPMGISSLRSVEFFIKDDVVCHDTVKHILQPEVKKRLKKEKEELKRRVYWLYENIISRLKPRGQQYRVFSRNNSSSNQEVPDSVFVSNGYSRSDINQPGKYHRSISQNQAPDSAYASHESSDYHNEASRSNCYTPATRLHNGQSPARGVKENVPYQTINSNRTHGEQNGFASNGSNSHQSDEISFIEAPDLNLGSMESLPSLEQPRRGKSHSDRLQNVPSLNGTSDKLKSNGKPHEDVVVSSQSNISDAFVSNIKSVRPIQDTKPRTEPATAVAASINPTHHMSRHHLSGNLPVPQEVECRGFKTMSLNSSNSMHSRTESSSPPRDSELSDHNLLSFSTYNSSGINSAEISHENSFRGALPDPRLISAQSLPRDISANINSSPSLHSTGERNVHPLAREINIDKFPSGNLWHSLNSEKFASSANRDQSSSSIASNTKTSLNISPIPQKISMNSFPTEEVMNNDLRSTSYTVPDVTQLPFGCLRPSDNFHDSYQPSFSQSEADSLRPVGVVKPFAMLDDDDDDDDIDFRNDLSMPVVQAEETCVKQRLQ
jgi:hypothetical protein